MIPPSQGIVGQPLFICGSCGFKGEESAHGCPVCGRPVSRALDELPLLPLVRLTGLGSYTRNTALGALGALVALGIVWLVYPTEERTVAARDASAAATAIVMATRTEAAAFAAQVTAQRAATATAAAEELAQAAAIAEAQDAAAAEAISDYLEDAAQYRRADQLGLALTTLDQAIAAEPAYRPAQALRAEVAAEATRQVARQQQAIAEAAAEAQRAAAAREAERLDATIAGYARTAPRGFWQGSRNRIGVGVGNFSYSSSAASSRAAPGSRFVAFGITVLNESNSTIHVNPNNVTLVDQRGASYAYNSATFSYCSNPLQGVDVRPGNTASGCIVFLVNSSTGPAKVIYRATLLGPDIVVDLERAPD